MDKGFEIELAGGTVIGFLPKPGKSALAVGSLLIEHDTNTGSFSFKGANGATPSTALVRIEPKSLTKNRAGKADPSVKSGVGTLTVCYICNGQTCCVTNACADFGCGWICD